MIAAQVLVLLANLYGTTIVVFLVGAAFLGSIGYLVDAFHQDRIADALRDCDVPAAAPATVPTPAPLQGRSLTNLANLQECYRRRSRADAATPGPWTAKGDQLRATHRDALIPEGTLVAYVTGHDHRLGFKKTGAAVDVEYAATVGPEVGLILADLLDEFANAAQHLNDYDGFDPFVTIDGYGHALTIARLINGGAA